MYKWPKNPIQSVCHVENTKNFRNLYFQIETPIKFWSATAEIDSRKQKI